MPDEKKKIVILGAGPAGLALALKLAQRPALPADVLVLEKNDQVGGLAASFTQDGLTFDLGSHRLHPATAPEILHELKDLLAEDLLDRPRYGRIRLLGRFVQFPLKPFELLAKLPLSFVLGFLADSLLKPFSKKREQKSFADVLQNGLGKTICNFFYFPYATKLWGLAPEKIAAVQAQRRVAANSVWKMIAKVLSMVPGFKRSGSGRFYYPRQGFGQISRKLAERVTGLGGHIILNSRIEKIEFADRGFTIARQGADPLHADIIFSTIPLTVLTRLLQPAPPHAVQQAMEKLSFRAMVLHYLVLETKPFTPFDAHYFPENELIFSRMSEPANYSSSSQPTDRTGLCFEIPCTVGDDIWRMTEQEMTGRVLADLRKCDLAVTCRVLHSFSKQVPFIYPVYDLTFAENLQTINDYLSQIPRLFSLGRQGLFVHDNTHHTIEMAWRAAECLRDDGVWDTEKWHGHLAAFAENVVED
jgi:protoporphyrinogen oxidase